MLVFANLEPNLNQPLPTAGREKTPLGCATHPTDTNKTHTTPQGLWYRLFWFKINCALEESLGLVCFFFFFYSWRVFSALGRRSRELWGGLERRDGQPGGPRASVQCQSLPGWEGAEHRWAGQVEQPWLPPATPAPLSSRGWAAGARGWAAELVQDIVLPAGNGRGKKERRQRKRITGNSIRKTQRETCFCSQIVSTTQLTHPHLRDRTLHKGNSNSEKNTALKGPLLLFPLEKLH